MAKSKEYILEWDEIIPCVWYGLFVHRSDGSFVGEAVLSFIQSQDDSFLKRLVRHMEDNQADTPKASFFYDDYEKRGPNE